jgi:hypothetical protein
LFSNDDDAPLARRYTNTYEAVLPIQGVPEIATQHVQQEELRPKRFLLHRCQRRAHDIIERQLIRQLAGEANAPTTLHSLTDREKR